MKENIILIVSTHIISDPYSTTSLEFKITLVTLLAPNTVIFVLRKKKKDSNYEPYP